MPTRPHRHRPFFRCFLLVGGLAAASLHLGLLFWSWPGARPAQLPSTTSLVRLAEAIARVEVLPSAESLRGGLGPLREQALLADSAPLFLPTRWNGGVARAVSVGEPGSVPLFAPFPENLSLSDQAFAGPETASGTGAPGPDVVLQLSRPQMGAGDLAMTAERALDERHGRVELSVQPVTGRGEGQRIALGEALPQSWRGRLWEPPLFSVQLEPAAAPLPARLLRSSGNGELDTWLGLRLAQALDEAALPAGTYRVQVWF